MIAVAARSERRTNLSALVSLYLARQFLLAFAGIAAVFLSVILVIDLIELLRRAAGKPDVPFEAVFSMALYKLPQTAQKTLVFAVLFGAMYAFWRANRSSELVALRASGVSVWQFLLPSLAAAVLLAALKAAAFNPLGAIMVARFEQLENRYLKGMTSLMAATSSGVWLRQADGEGQSVIHAEQAKVGARELELRPVIVLFYKGEDNFQGRIDAERAVLQEGRWVLTKARTSFPDRAGQMHETYELKTNLTLPRIQNSFSSPATVSFWELPAFIQSLEATGFSALGHRLHWHSLLADTLLYASMILIAAIFSLRHVRRRGVLIAVAGGIAAGFIVFFMADLVLALAFNSRLPPMMAAWSTPLAAALFGAAVLMHIEDG
jgi:lipopolysaccharide export system permease protein